MASRNRKFDSADAAADTARRLALGSNLRKARTRRGLSIGRFAEKSGISRAMISQIELGISSPSVNVMSKLTRCLGVPFTALLGSPARAEAAVVRATPREAGAFRIRALSPGERRVELHELSLSPGHAAPVEPYAARTTVNVVVTAGTLELGTADEAHRLEIGDSMIFAADEPHTYRNIGTSELVIYRVTVRADD